MVGEYGHLYAAINSAKTNHRKAADERYRRDFVQIFIAKFKEDHRSPKVHNWFCIYSQALSITGL
jgi:hypothetical protein